MTYLVTHFWAWWMTAVAIGAATALTIARRPERGVAGWLVWFGLAVAVGAPVAYLQILSGRAGLWLETGLALFLGFIAGAALGAVVGGRSLREHEGWAIGLAPLALVWIGAGVLGGASLESELKRRVVSAVEKLGGDGAKVEVFGRDITLPNGMASRAEAELGQIAGVRRIVENDAPAGEGGTRPTPVPRQDAKAGSILDDAPVVEPPARPETPRTEPAAPARSTVASLDKDAALKSEPRHEPPATGELDAVACQKAVAATLAQEPIRFARNGGVRRASSGMLDKAVGLLQRCPAAKVEVRAYAETADAPARSLARDRAERVADYLSRMGVDRGRLVAAGLPSAPGSAEGKRGVELIVAPHR